MIVKPSEENLLRWQAQELLQSFVFLQQTIQFWVELDVNLTEQTASNYLPNKTEDEMLANLDDVSGTNIYDGAANTLC